MRIGIGYDIHQLKATKEGGIWLGGHFISCPWQVISVSDGDVLLHALTDALLGALACGDIGSLFPPDDPINQNRPSSDFIAAAMANLAPKAYQICNIDAVIICETPSIGKHRQQIINSLAKILKIPPEKVFVKGKTNEQLDAIGRKEAIAAHVVCLLEKIQ